MAYVQCMHCGRGAVTGAYVPGTAYCARCGARLPNPAGCATSAERHLRLLPGSITRSRGVSAGDDWDRVAA